MFMMTIPAALSKKLQFFFHCFGLSSLGGAIFLQVLVFSDILFNGYFMAIEKNQLVLSLEVGLTGFAAAYFVFIYLKLMRQAK